MAPSPTTPSTTQSTTPSAGQQPPDSPLLDRVPGAVPLPSGGGTPGGTASAPDAGVAWHYGDPMREQRLLAAGEAVTDLSHRGLLIVTGEARLSWLQALTTQQVSDLAPGRPVESLVLSPYGHVEHALHLVDDGERAWISVDATSMRPALDPASTAEPLADWLRSMRFRTRVTIEDVTGQWAAIGMVLAPDAALPPAVQAAVDAAFAAADAPDGTGPVPPSWQDPWPAPGENTGLYTAGTLDDHPGWRRPWREVWVPRAGFADAVAALPLAGSWASEALRVAAWRPRAGCDTDHRTLPHEVDWMRTGLHLNKGCYRGQETVSRVHHLGKPPRRLVMLHLDGSEHDLPAAGDPVYLMPGAGAGGGSGDPDESADVPGGVASVRQGRPVGQVTSPVRHHEWGPIALALVKRSLPTDAALRVLPAGASPDGERGQAASQEAIVADATIS